MVAVLAAGAGGVATVSSGDGEGGNGGKLGKGCQGTCIKDPGTKLKGVWNEERKCRWVGQGMLWQENGDNCT